MAMNEQRRSGRQARAAERSRKGGGIGRPYILRNIPTYDILSEESLVRIENAADRILAETGIEFRDDPVALDHWRRAGAEVQGDLVKFPPGLLREVLQTAPASSPSTPAIPRTTLRSAGKNVVFAPPTAAPS
jgi:trimethylamine--corrinoid protein Co-methyltransferase